MISMEPVLKRGYAAWDREVLPDDEYGARIDAVRAAMRAGGLEALIVVNHSLLGVMVDYADIAYLTGLQSGGVLLIAREGDPTFITFGGGRELSFLRSQTWISHVVAGGSDVFGVLRAQLQARGIAEGAIGTVGTLAMAADPLSRFTKALADYEVRPFDANLRHIRAVKRPREILAVRIAKGIVDDAIAAALTVFAADGDNTAAMLEAERAARRGKARDVRVLANMGGAELRPFEGRLDGRHSPLRLWVAAQYQGYWAEAATTHPAPAAKANLASRAVLAMQEAALAGNPAADVAAAALAVIPAGSAESALAYGLGATIGLALNEGLVITPKNRERLVDGCLLSLRACVTSAEEPSLDSALVRVSPTGAHRLEPLRLT